MILDQVTDCFTIGPRSVELYTKNGPSLHLRKFFTPSGLKLPKKQKSDKILKGKNEALYKRYKSYLMNCQTYKKPSGIICKNEGGVGPGAGGREGVQNLFMQKWPRNVIFM